MPTPEEILRSLDVLSNEARWLAAGWHALIAIFFGGLLAGWRPDRRRLATVLMLPLLSAGIVSSLARNPVNGGLFVAASFGLVVLAFRGARERLRIPASGLAGLPFVGVGFVYPHFVRVAGPWEYLFFAPVGVIPCPTLLMVGGVALLFGRAAARPWAVVLVPLSAFYGLFGWLRLGVRIDAVLVVAAAGLLGTALLPREIPPLQRK